MSRRPSRSTLFPYTTHFRSWFHPSRRRGPRRHRSRGALCRHGRSEEHTSELQSLRHLVCRLMLEKKKNEPKFIEIGTSPHVFTTLHAIFITTSDHYLIFTHS